MKKTIITLSIIIVVFAIIAFSVTFVLINKNKDGVNDLDDKNNVLENIQEKTLDLNAMYDENDLIIEEITYNGIQIPQIEGLKKKDIQNKVNQSIKNRFIEIKEKHPDYEFQYRITGNFANIISITAYLNKDIQISEDEYEYYYQQYGINYELVNGEKIKLEDVFTKNTNIIDVVRTQFYNQLAMYNSYDMYDENGNKLDPVSYEEKLYKVVKEFMTSDNNKFTISPSVLILYNDDNIASLDLMENADKIVIYDKYMIKESIFERDDIGRKGIFTCVDTTSYNETFNETIIGYLEDNFWCDVIEIDYYDNIPSDMQPKIEEIRKQIKDDINEKIEKYREIARKNPDKFYVFSNRQSFYPLGVLEYDVDSNSTKADYIDYVEIQNDQLYYYMSKEYYEKEYIKSIAEHYRNEYFYMSVSDRMLGEELIRFSEEKIGIIDYEYIKDSNIYNLDTKQRFNDFSDILKDEYITEYTDIIANRIVDLTDRRKENIEYEEAKELLEKAELNFAQFYIDINIEGYEDLYLTIYYKDFPRYMFKENLSDLLDVIYN